MASGVCEGSCQETTGIERALQKEPTQAQMRQRKKYDEKIIQAKPYAMGQYVWVFQNIRPPKGTKKLLQKWRVPFMITEVHQQGQFYRLSTGRAAHYENLKPHVPSPDDWCVPQNMEELEYLLVEPACEVNEKCTREKNDGNEDNEKIDVDSDGDLLRRKIGMIQSRTRCQNGRNQTCRRQQGQEMAMASGE